MHAVKLSSANLFIPTFKCVNTLDFKTGVFALATLNQNRFAVGGGGDRTGSKMAIWDISGNPVDAPFEQRVISCIQPFNQGNSVIAAGMSSVIGSPDGYFSVWQLNPPNSSNDHWQPLDKAVSALVVHPNKPWIVTGDRGGLIKFWNLYQSPCVNVFHVEKEGYVKSLAFLNDGSILASGHNTNINIWDVKTGNKLSTIRNHKRPVVALTEMGKGILASGSDDCTVKIWNISNPTYPTMINTLDKVYKGAAFAFTRMVRKNTHLWMGRSFICCMEY